MAGRALNARICMLYSVGGSEDIGCSFRIWSVESPQARRSSCLHTIGRTPRQQYICRHVRRAIRLHDVDFITNTTTMPAPPERFTRMPVYQHHVITGISIPTGCDSIAYIYTAHSSDGKVPQTVDSDN